MLKNIFQSFTKRSVVFGLAEGLWPLVLGAPCPWRGPAQLCSFWFAWRFHGTRKHWYKIPSPTVTRLGATWFLVTWQSDSDRVTEMPWALVSSSGKGETWTRPLTLETRKDWTHWDTLRDKSASRTKSWESWQVVREETIVISTAEGRNSDQKWREMPL